MRNVFVLFVHVKNKPLLSTFQNYRALTRCEHFLYVYASKIQQKDSIRKYNLLSHILLEVIFLSGKRHRDKTSKGDFSVGVDAIILNYVLARTKGTIYSEPTQDISKTFRHSSLMMVMIRNPVDILQHGNIYLIPTRHAHHRVV